MTRSIDAPPVKVGTAEVVLEAVVVEAGAVEVEVTVEVIIFEEEEVEEAVEVAVGVVKVEMIPLPLTGYYQQISEMGYVPATGRWCKRAWREWLFQRSRTFGMRWP
jgi:hypothetical protein